MGLSALSATPATAAGLPFPNCDAAAAVGVYNIPIGTPGYGAHLDRNNDGVGCDSDPTRAYDASIVAGLVAAPVATVAPTTPVAPKATVAPKAPAVTKTPVTKQIVRVPVGGADTGVATKGTDNSAALALGGGLVLAAAAAGTFVVRRRNA